MKVMRFTATIYFKSGEYTVISFYRISEIEDKFHLSTIDRIIF
ncbi:hypothetical protein [Bacillus cereus]|nr:hypothetical protein [Bacillus cereus]